MLFFLFLLLLLGVAVFLGAWAELVALAWAELAVLDSLRSDSFSVAA